MTEQAESKHTETLSASSSCLDQLKTKMISLEIDKESLYRQIESIDQKIAKIRKKIDLVNMLGTSPDAEDLINSIVKSEVAHPNCIQPAPAAMSMSAEGKPGQISYDNQFLYVCVDTNTWRRSPLVMWTQK